jgi:Xaa-Pro aminopeptidase
MTNRLTRLAERIEDPLLVTEPTNVRYLTGFASSNAALLVERDRIRLFTDFRYWGAAQDVPDVEPVLTKRNLIGELAEALGGRVAFERSLQYGHYETLRDGGLDLVPTSGAVESLRAVKDDDELAILRRACAITDRVFERLTDVRFVGRTELDVAWDLAQLFHEEGGQGLAFESIVGSGPTGSRPHARAGDRTIGTGELVVIDAGCTVDGYASDCTRTFATGPLDGEAKEAYETVLLAQQRALDGIRAGLSGVEADALARGVIDESPFSGAMGHGLGHGLGLDVHESPRLSKESTDVLEPGNVVTVEPGVYVDGRFGVRIENDVVVTANGMESLTGFRRDLIEVA